MSWEFTVWHGPYRPPPANRMSHDGKNVLSVCCENVAHVPLRALGKKTHIPISQGKWACYAAMKQVIPQRLELKKGFSCASGGRWLAVRKETVCVRTVGEDMVTWPGSMNMQLAELRAGCHTDSHQIYYWGERDAFSAEPPGRLSGGGLRLGSRLLSTQPIATTPGIGNGCL